MIRRSILRFASAAVFVASGFPGTATAQDDNVLERFERVLVPISVGMVQGAYGSVWWTEMWYRNNSNVPVAMFPVAISDFVPKIGRTDLLPIFFLPPSAPGQFLFIGRNGGDKVQFDLRLFNRADPQAAWGTKLPVVREREFVEAISLINVPTGPEFRSALRIYGLPDELSLGETVHVAVYSYDEQLLVSAELPFELAFEGGPRYAAMRYSEILSLADAFPEIRQADRVRVHVESSSGLKIWGFVSVVSNATQHVSLVNPD